MTKRKVTVPFETIRYDILHIHLNLIQRKSWPSIEILVSDLLAEIEKNMFCLETTNPNYF
jgi:hypothetical protein